MQRCAVSERIVLSLSDDVLVKGTSFMLVRSASLLLSSVFAVAPLMYGVDRPHPSEIILVDDDGIRVEAPPVAEPWRPTPWPAEEEAAYWRRANWVFNDHAGSIGVQTHGEREKDTFPKTMFNYLPGQHEQVVEALQTRDRQADTDHSWTEGIDFYWTFTIKGQMRKYFFFGPALDPDYRQRMYDGAAAWTEVDPRPSFELVRSLRSDDPQVRSYAATLLQQFRENIAEIDPEAVEGDIGDPLEGEDLGVDFEAWTRWWQHYADQGWKTYENIERLANPYPHPVHGVGSGPVGATWDPPVRGMRVDARNTDNMRAMRNVAVYLMAEETGNEQVQRLYRDKLRDFIVHLYRLHHGEWDSENYLHHTIAPFHNLYDFAQDREVVGMAKAALDYLYASAAVKYYRGHSLGPTKRTGGGLEDFVWLHFGDETRPPNRAYYDLFHVVSSSYRPPLAAVQIGRGNFARPIELINAKPEYDYWLPGRDQQPSTWETLYFGEHFYMGSAVSRGPQGDVRAWDVALNRADGGADLLRANSGRRINGKRRGDQIGQYRNLAIWLRQDDSARFVFEMPPFDEAHVENDVWFLRHGKTFLALYPINLPADAWRNLLDADGTTSLQVEQHAGDYAGFALHLLDASQVESFAAFRQAASADAVLDISSLAQGQVRVQGLDGSTLRMHYNSENDLPHIERDGQPLDWQQMRNPYQGMDENAPIQVDGEAGELRLQAGPHRFVQSIDHSGAVTTSVDE